MRFAGRLKSRLFQKIDALLPRNGFIADREGTTAVEFAMIAVPFLGLIGAIFETGTIYFRTAQLQMATETASRAVLTHSTAAGLTYKQFVDNNICTWKTQGVVKPGTLSTMFDCDKIMVDVRSPANWGAADTGNNFYNSPNAGGSVIAMPAPGQIAIVRIAYPMTVISGILGGGVFKGQSYGQIRTGQVQYNSAWTNMLMGIAAFRVEP
ncbi:pilus assembly protein [Methylocystis sp. WRRC1]|uniref:TadE/TadG family type IV pilus assembly protein n=1 Tax=unclassified Methylocystis TaxID=2625913 RepID=UPI0001F8681F|nr:MULTISPECIES: TadE/TadG family type IV pilus assembly protein [unclassified Methylocystis]MCC3247214.1 pilus assembly protein [Methylocystis sp. WRRC1]